jgi:hypothetical protein
MKISVDLNIRNNPDLRGTENANKLFIQFFTGEVRDYKMNLKIGTLMTEVNTYVLREVNLFLKDFKNGKDYYEIQLGSIESVCSIKLSKDKITFSGFLNLELI